METVFSDYCANNVNGEEEGAAGPVLCFECIVFIRELFEVAVVTRDFIVTERVGHAAEHQG